MATKDWLEIIVIPVALAFLPLIWGLVGWWIRRIQFQELIFRELEEISPYPPTRREATTQKNWPDHHNPKIKQFLHTAILSQPTENRDFILSLPADIVYFVSQLWSSQEDANQWMEMLSKLQKKVPPWRYHRRKRLAKVKGSWDVLMKEYDPKIDAKFEKNIA